MMGRNPDGRGKGWGNALIYLDHAATSWPKPACVGRAILTTMTDAGGNPGRSAHPLSMRAAETVFSAREHTAEFFGVPEPENVLFYPNATWAINTVLHSFGVKRSDGRIPRILVSGMEHNAVVRPLYDMEMRGEVMWDVYPVFRGAQGMLSEEEILSEIRRRITRDTALVCACHVSNVCGAALPIGKIGGLCRARGIPFLVDASQSAGMYDIHVERDNIDYLCTAGHKALLGPQGSGLLLLGGNAPVPRSLVQGGNGVASLSPAMPDFLPEALEAGTLAAPIIAGLDAGIRYLSAVGLDTVRGETHRLYERMREMLLSLDGVTLYQSALPRGTALSFGVRGMSCMRVSEALGRDGICTRAGFHCAPFAHRAFGTENDGTVRVSVGWGNTMRDAEIFYRAMKRICGEGAS
ncbi:MAG: aminotransferase class V-fold PLP-dependent enzyme [Clostridia bacterium]|nr:aminotransferase class V-fold PLP-dependent enzyme [Clostridia bacterium]